MSDAEMTYVSAVFFLPYLPSSSSLKIDQGARCTCPSSPHIQIDQRLLRYTLLVEPKGHRSHIERGKIRED